MAHCNGSCASCGGCAKTLLLSPGEVMLLQTLGQIPFLPIARKKEDMVPVYLEDTQFSQEEYSLILQVLEQKNLIILDYDKPLSGFDAKAYKDYPIHGSMALTQRGQIVVDMLDKQGIPEE
ncbi:MAG: hypothetical protein IKC95_00535 [Oscillospiraceae bacterium]|nr:hypothetical protein [Oscillospiraceae bacterium]